MSQLPSQMRALWEQLSSPQKLALGGIAVAALVGLLALAVFARSPEFAVAYGNLNEQDASQITAKLQEAGIPYELQNGGTTILVPSNQVDQVRLTMAGQGLPTSGVVGFEIFNQQNFGMTEFTQRVNLRRALEGELSRTIQTLEAVEIARVSLVLPQETLFTEQEKDPTASVLLKLKPGHQLTPDQVKAITNLVAKSVEGLQPANVTIVDVNGTELTAFEDQTAAGLTSKQQEIQRDWEILMQRDLQNMLDRVFGPGKAIARVRAELNWDQYERHAELYSAPEDQVQGLVRSSKVTQETFSGQPGTQAGIPGAPSNIPQPAGGANSGPIQFTRNEETVNRELSKTVESLIKTPGAVNRLSVGVMYDNPDATPAQIQQIEEAVTAAAGLNPDRGDTVKVTALAFDRTTIEQQAQDLAHQQQLEFYLSLAKIVAVVVIAILMLVVIRSLIRRQSSASDQPQLALADARAAAAGAIESASAVPSGIPAAQAAAAYAQIADSPLGDSPTSPPGLPAGMDETDAELARIQAERERARVRRDLEAENRLRKEEERLREIQDRAQEAARRRNLLETEVREIAKSSPESVADLIRGWLDDERRM